MDGIGQCSGRSAAVTSISRSRLAEPVSAAGAGRVDIALTAVLFVQGMLQTVFVLQRETSPAIAALHPVNGVAMLIIAIYLGIDDWRLLRGSAVEHATQASEPSPQA